MTAPLFLLALAGAALALIRRNRTGLFWVSVLAVYILPFQFGAAILLVHFILFAVIPLASLASYAIEAAADRLSRAQRRIASAPLAASIFFGAAMALVACPLALRDYAVATHPATAPLASRIRVGFIDGWPSGYGSVGVARFLETQAAASPSGIRVILFAVGDGVKNALTLALMRSPRIEFQDTGMAVAESLERTRATVASIDVAKPKFVVMDDPPFLLHRQLDLQPLMANLIPVFREERPESTVTVIYSHVGQAGILRPIVNRPFVSGVQIH
jgi:hypothetical protein